LSCFFVITAFLALKPGADPDRQASALRFWCNLAAAMRPSLQRLESYVIAAAKLQGEVDHGQA